MKKWPQSHTVASSKTRTRIQRCLSLYTRLLPWREKRRNTSPVYETVQGLPRPPPHPCAGSPGPRTAPSARRRRRKEPAALPALFQHSGSPRAAAAATPAANVFKKKMKLEWKCGNSRAMWPLQCSICQDSGRVSCCTDFRNCHSLDGSAFFLLGKPIAGLKELPIPSSCPRLCSQKPYCPTSCNSIIKIFIPGPSLFTSYKPYLQNGKVFAF